MKPTRFFTPPSTDWLLRAAALEDSCTDGPLAGGAILRSQMNQPNCDSVVEMLERNTSTDPDETHPNNDVQILPADKLGHITTSPNLDHGIRVGPAPCSEWLKTGEKGWEPL